MSSKPTAPSEPDAQKRAGIDASRPNVARMYNWFLGDPNLGGKDVREIDREAGALALARNPRSRDYAVANRQFLGRAVGYLAGEAGIDQFLDLGTGYPDMGNVHEVAQKFQPQARTVYVDYDPVVAAHGRALLATDERTHMLELDLRDPEEILKVCREGHLLDLSRPVGVLAVAVLHFIEAIDKPYKIIKLLMEAVPLGSFLVLTHVLTAPETVAGAVAYAKASAPLVLRNMTSIHRFFTYAGVGLVNPGLVRLPLWRPDDLTRYQDDAAMIHLLGGVAIRS